MATSCSQKFRSSFTSSLIGFFPSLSFDESLPVIVIPGRRRIASHLRRWGREPPLRTFPAPWFRPDVEALDIGSVGFGGPSDGIRSSWSPWARMVTRWIRMQDGHGDPEFTVGE